MNAVIHETTVQTVVIELSLVQAEQLRRIAGWDYSIPELVAGIEGSPEFNATQELLGALFVALRDAGVGHPGS